MRLVRCSFWKIERDTLEVVTQGFFYLTSYLIDMSKYNVNTTVKYQYQEKKSKIY